MNAKFLPGQSQAVVYVSPVFIIWTKKKFWQKSLLKGETDNNCPHDSSMDCFIKWDGELANSLAANINHPHPRVFFYIFPCDNRQLFCNKFQLQLHKSILDCQDIHKVKPYNCFFVIY